MTSEPPGTLLFSSAYSNLVGRIKSGGGGGAYQLSGYSCPFTVEPLINGVRMIDGIGESGEAHAGKSERLVDLEALLCLLADED